MPPLLVTAAFLSLLALPTVERALRLDPTAGLQENRKEAPWPGWPRRFKEARRLPAALEAYHADHLGWRSLLIRTHGLLKLKVLGMSPTEKVVVGRDGMLFYVGEGALTAYRALRPFSEADLAQWARVLDARRAKLASCGIAFVFMVAPEKATIYPELMPGYLAPVRLRTRLDRLVERLRAETDVMVVDPREALRRARAGGPVYHRLDTHWTERGCVTVAMTLLDAIRCSRPDLPSLGEEDFVQEAAWRPNGDLTTLCGLRGMAGEPTVLFVPRHPRAARAGETPVRSQHQVTWARLPWVLERPGSGLPRALVWNDSFMDNLAPFLAEHFQRMTFLRNGHSPWDPSIVEDEQPDVVVLEMAERYLEGKPPAS